MVFYLYIYSHILVTVVKDFIKQDQHIKRTLDNSLQEQNYLSNLFFPYCIKEWNNLSEELRKIKSTDQFKTKILSLIRPKENSIFQIHDINDIKLLNRLRLQFSHLNEHKFRYNFRATIDPMCCCSLEPETTPHYLLRCNLYSDLRTEFLNDICALNPNLKKLSHEKLLNILLYGSEDFSFITNKKIMKSTIKFLKTSERFIGSLF